MSWIRRREHNLLTNAASLLVCGALAGVVVAAAAFPALAMSGLAVKGGTETFDSLPSIIAEEPSPQITNIYASDGKTLLALMYDENRQDVSFDEIAPVMRHAIVAAEDNRFYKHNGVDFKGVARAFVSNQQSGTSQGASTLTMQYVRQAISYSAPTPQDVLDATVQTPTRKLREMRYAIELEKRLSKDEILVRYLNISPFGHGAYGVFAASQAYFHKNPKDLDLAEATLLAGLVQAPSLYDPATPEGLPRAIERRDYVLNQMVKLGYATPAEVAEARKEIPKIYGDRAPEGCVSVPAQHNDWGFFCDYLYRWWLQQKAFGKDPYERLNRLKAGGYSVVSSLDVQTQAAAKAAVDRKLPVTDWRALMVAAVEPGTGYVRALATNRVYSNDQTNNGPSTNPGHKGQKGNYPNTTIPLLTGGGDIVGYQFGSTFKMFTMVAALEKGMPLSYQINAVSPYQSKYIIQKGSPAACPGTYYYCPVNANPAYMNGPNNMWTGFGRSVNTYFVPLEEKAGADRAIDVAKRLGVQFRDSHDNDLATRGAAQFGSFTLGVTQATPLDMANAYATLANDGTYCEPMPVVEVRDRDGKKMDIGPRCKNVVAPDVARAAVDAARCPIGDQGPLGGCNGGTAAYVRGLIPKQYPIAGKTGTTDDEFTASMIAMTPQLSVAGIEADPDWVQHVGFKASHDHVNVAVAETLRDAMSGKQPEQFQRPSDKIAYGAGGKKTPLTPGEKPTDKPQDRPQQPQQPPATTQPNTLPTTPRGRR